LRLSERRATNIGLLYPKVRNNIGGDIAADVPPNKILGDVSPASPAGLTPVPRRIIHSLCYLNEMNEFNYQHRYNTAGVIKDMLRIKSRQAEIPGFSSSDVDFILECLCVS